MPRSIRVYSCVLSTLSILGLTMLVICSSGPAFAGNIAKPESPERTIEPGEVPAFKTRYAGRWGEIACRELVLEPTSDTVTVYPEFETWKEPVTWAFRQSPGGVRQLLRESGLLEGDVEALLATARNDSSSGGGTRVFPSDEVIRHLSPEMRALLYRHIGQDVEGNLFRYPYVLWNGGFSRMAGKTSGLSTNRISQIERMSFWGKGNDLLFSDVRWTLQQARSETERLGILKTFHREMSMLAWLDLSALEDQSREEILEYWTASRRNEKARGLIETALENPAIHTIELGRLLPAKNKGLLNTYPNTGESIGNFWPDCFSTAFTFFSNDVRSGNLVDFKKVAEERYERAELPPQLGDILVIKDSDSKWIHACNYIAGDIMFTKNGKSERRPWVFQQLDDILASYLNDDKITAFYLRLKPEYRE